MHGSAGVSTQLRNIAPPNLRRIKRTVSLPKEARLRLAWLDYYFKHGHNAVLTCRHFGIAESCFFKWKRRYRAQGPRGLMDKPKRPRTVRQTLIPVAAVDRVRSLRKLSKYKLQVIYGVTMGMY